MEKDRSDRLSIAREHLKRANNPLKAAITLFEEQLYSDVLSRGYCERNATSLPCIGKQSKQEEVIMANLKIHKEV